MPANSGVMIPFGSSEKNFRVAMNDLLNIYLCTMLAIRSKLITLALFSADEAYLGNTSLTWVSAVNNSSRVYLLFLCRHAFCKKLFLESESLKSVVGGCRVLKFCFWEINSAKVIDWQLRFSSFLVTFPSLCCRVQLASTARQLR